MADPAAVGLTNVFRAGKPVFLGGDIEEAPLFAVGTAGG